MPETATKVCLTCEAFNHVSVAPCNQIHRTCGAFWEKHVSPPPQGQKVKLPVCMVHVPL